MNLAKSLTATLISTALCLPAFAQESMDFSKRLYVGSTGGASKLSPESERDDYVVDDDVDSGGKLLIGYDFSPDWAIEFSAADLGAAAIGERGTGVDIGTISYDVMELSAVYHFYNLSGYDAKSERRGLGAFVKLGIGAMDNDSPEDIPFERENDAHLSGGIGVEYGTRIGLALRGEIEAFDKDAMLSSLGLLWRFGGKGGSSNDGLFSKGGAMVGGLIDGAKENLPMIGDDADGDGVPDSLDDCMGTPAGEPVTATGCAMFGGVLEGVGFESGSDRLVDEAQVVLNDAADALLADPSLKVEVRAHTDSQGAADYNLELSRKRALSTVRYLMLRGVPSEQMTARAYGEAKPIADNDTAEGREQNRRVEFHVIER